MFERQAASGQTRWPRWPAAERFLSYRELARRAAAWAGRLRRSGVGRGSAAWVSC